MSTPFSNRPKITPEDLNRGFVNRYFVKNISDRRIVEVDAEQYKSFASNLYFETIVVPWVITGNEEDTIDPSTGKLVLGVPKRNLQIIDYYDSKMKGLRRNLRNPMEYFNGTPAKPKFPSPPIIETPPYIPPFQTREFKYQFQQSQFLEGASITHRPDAVSFDYKTAFTLGPLVTGSVVPSLFERVWKVWDSGSAIWYAGANTDSWSEEKRLFSYTGTPVVELDTAFEQLGRFNVVIQRDKDIGRWSGNGIPEVWVYWFDPIPSTFVFQNVGYGRTPRIALDNWQDPTNSDVLVFYIHDVLNRICYRAQKDRFEVEYITPIVTTEYTYLEKVGLAKDLRFRVTYSQLNTLTGKYELKQLASDRFPVIIPAESYVATGSFVSATITELVKSQTLYSPESYIVTGSLVSANIQDIVIAKTLYEPESYIVTGSLVSAVVLEIIKSTSLYEPESYIASGSFVSVEVPEILISRTLYEPESYVVTGSFVNAEIVIP